MPSTATTRFQGWSVVWAAFTVCMFGSGVGYYGPSVYLQTLHSSHGWPISTISVAVTTHFLLSAAVVAFLPDIHRRFGIARATIAGSLLVAAGICGWGNAREIWQLFPAASLSGAGFALIGGAAINAMVARWFDRDRPKALSTALNGASIGGVVFAPLWVTIIAQVGFRWAAVVIAATMACVLVPLSCRFLRFGPADLGLLPDGRPGTTPPARLAVPMSRTALLRDGRFVTVSSAFAVGLFAQIGVYSHFLTRVAPDLGTKYAAAALSLTTICAVLGRTALGWLIGEHDRRLAATANFMAQAVGVLLLSFGHGPSALILGCVLFGLGVGNLFSLPPLIAQAEFDSADVGMVVALVTGINQVVFGLAPAIFGMLHDLTGSYMVPFTLAWVLQIIAAMIVAIGRRRAV
jgi:MFS family permease